MVVARRNESKLSSSHESTEDLLIIPFSETDSVDEEITPVPRVISQLRNDGSILTSSTNVCAKSGGRRKRRQYENFIDLLNKGPVDVCVPTIEDFLPMRQRSLISLLEECSIYTAFCSGCEDFFYKIDAIKNKRGNKGQRKFKLNKENEELMTVLCISSSSHSLDEIKSLLKVEESVRCSVVNGSVPQILMKDLEEKIVQFFVNNPREMFMSRGFTSVERTALYAISSFHSLTYKCFRKRRYHIVQVTNANYAFDQPLFYLSKIISKCIPGGALEDDKC